MSNQTFDFSEALRRMKEGKKVRRLHSILAFGTDGSDIIIYGCGMPLSITNMQSYDILATDWKEVKNDKTSISSTSQR